MSNYHLFLKKGANKAGFNRRNGNKESEAPEGRGCALRKRKDHRQETDAEVFC